MRKTYITAFIIAVATIAWLASGQFGAGPDEATRLSITDRNDRASAAVEDRAPSRVRARISTAVEQTAFARVRGRTENKRTVDVRAETVGRVVARPVELGDRVATGDALCHLSMDDRAARLVEAQAAVRQAHIEYRGTLRLKSAGLQSETAIAAAGARLAATRAGLESIELDIARTRVRAPFRGMVEITHVEVGDYVQPGAACVTLVDLDPMLLVGQITERDVARIRVGEQAFGELATGERLSGSIGFIGQQADPTTRTYRVEIEVPNADYALRSGITADILIAAETSPAHHVSPALFALDDEGAVGIRLVDGNDRVAFRRVEILRDEAEGVWVTGLPEVATIITVGHEFVVPGEALDIDFEPTVESVVAERNVGDFPVFPVDAELPDVPSPEPRGAFEPTGDAPAIVPKPTPALGGDGGGTDTQPVHAS